MPMFKKKPVVIEARQFTGGGEVYDLIHWINEGQNANNRGLAYGQNQNLMIPTLEGDHLAQPGDWIIKGVAGELYPCKPGIFAATHEPP